MHTQTIPSVAVIGVYWGRYGILCQVWSLVSCAWQARHCAATAVFSNRHWGDDLTEEHETMVGLLKRRSPPSADWRAFMMRPPRTVDAVTYHIAYLKRFFPSPTHDSQPTRDIYLGPPLPRNSLEYRIVRRMLRLAAAARKSIRDGSYLTALAVSDAVSCVRRGHPTVHVMECDRYTVRSLDGVI